MPRFARVVVPGCPHHITYRGNRRDEVFFTDEDREEYLAILLEYTRQYGVDISTLSGQFYTGRIELA